MPSGCMCQEAGTEKGGRKALQGGGVSMLLPVRRTHHVLSTARRQLLVSRNRFWQPLAVFLGLPPTCIHVVSASVIMACSNTDFCWPVADGPCEFNLPQVTSLLAEAIVYFRFYCLEVRALLLEQELIRPPCIWQCRLWQPSCQGHPALCTSRAPASMMSCNIAQAQQINERADQSQLRWLGMLQRCNG